MSWNVDTNAWAVETFGKCQLGDKRRTKRLVNMAQRIIDNPSGGIALLMELVRLATVLVRDFYCTMP